jgi:hypothetical protein
MSHREGQLGGTHALDKEEQSARLARHGAGGSCLSREAIARMSVAVSAMRVAAHSDACWPPRSAPSSVTAGAGYHAHTRDGLTRRSAQRP